MQLSSYIWTEEWLARFDNTIFATIKNSLFIGLTQIPKTVAMIIFCAVPFILILFNWFWMPVFILIGFSIVAFTNASWMVGIFKKFEPEEENDEEIDEGIFEGSDSLSLEQEQEAKTKKSKKKQNEHKQ